MQFQSFGVWVWGLGANGPVFRDLMGAKRESWTIRHTTGSRRRTLTTRRPWSTR